MRCEEIMKRNVECVSPRDTAEDAAGKMRDANVGFLPVCDQSGKALGAITDRDLAIRIVAEAKDCGTLVEDAMTREVVSCRPEEDLRDAQAAMAEHEKSRIMCLDADGRLQGIISLTDIAQHETGERVAETLRDVNDRQART